MRMLPSWALFALIVVGGGVVVIANTLYPLARARETKEQLANDARAIISPEIKGNLALVGQFQTALEAGNMPNQKFDVTAWETISKGGLLLGLKSDDISKLLHAYSLIYRANEAITKILETVTGIGSAMQNAAATRQMFLAQLKSIVDELKIALSDLEKTSQV
jgi:sensor domain CHASE-containing protein